MTKIKKKIAIVLSISIILSFFQPFVMDTNAEQADRLDPEAGYSIGEIGGYLIANTDAINKLWQEKKFNTPTGHGFAAERGNNLVDKMHGTNAIIQGDNNAPNGPDRLIINRTGQRILIQDKYYADVKAGIRACFDDETGLFRYMDGNQKPMQIEVPSDQFDDAVAALEGKIAEGKVPGVSDPAEAKNIIRKGKLTYKQAVNLTKAGKIESLVYDAANGTVSSLFAAGISFAIDFAICKLNGVDTTEALKESALNGLKTGAVVMATYVVSAQLAKTGLPKVLAPLTDAVAKRLGEGVSRGLAEMYGTTATAATGLSSQQIVSRVSSILQNQIITSSVLIVVLTIGDIIKLFQGKISKEQFLKNLVVTVSSVGGGAAGTVAGAAIGTAIMPGAGSLIGGIIGGAAGSAGGGAISNALASQVYKGDAQIMFDIVSQQFQELAAEYLITMNEGEQLTDVLQAKLNSETLQNMFASDDRERFARDLMTPLFDEQIAKRDKLGMPTTADIRNELKNELLGIVYIH